MVHTGFVVLADISGYTRFLGETELSHAQGILHDLLTAMIDELHLPLALSSVRGDAVVAHAPASNLAIGLQLVEAVEAIYVAFRGTLAHMQRNTTCPCDACAGMGALDLKIVVHFGEYVLQTLAGRPELQGAEVVTAFRLLKNDIIDQTGVEAYGAFSEAAVAALDAPEWFEGLIAHTQATEDRGDVALRVMDLRPAWDRAAAEDRQQVGADEPRYFADVEHLIPAPIEHVWSVASEPAFRQAWFPTVVSAGMDAGRVDIGTVVHCAHTSGPPTVYTVVDLEPFEFQTFALHLPMGGRLRITVWYTTVDEGTRISVGAAKAEAKSGFKQGLLRFLTNMQRKKQRQMWIDGFEKLEAAVLEACAGHVATPAAPAEVAALRGVE